MNKRDILAELKTSLYYDYVQQWTNLYKGDTAARHSYASIAASKVQFAKAILGSQYHNQINALADTVERKASIDAAA